MHIVADSTVVRGESSYIVDTGRMATDGRSSCIYISCMYDWSKRQKQLLQAQLVVNAVHCSGAGETMIYTCMHCAVA